MGRDWLDWCMWNTFSAGGDMMPIDSDGHGEHRHETFALAYSDEVLELLLPQFCSIKTRASVAVQRLCVSMHIVLRSSMVRAGEKEAHRARWHGPV